MPAVWMKPVLIYLVLFPILLLVMVLAYTLFLWAWGFDAPPSLVATYLAFFCCGGVLLVALSVRPLFRQVWLVALITLAGGLLYQSVPDIDFYTGYRVADFLVYAFVLFGLLYWANAMLLVLTPLEMAGAPWGRN